MPPTSSKRRIWGLTTGTLCLVLWLLLSGGDGPGFALAAALVAGVSAAALTPASLPSIAFLPALGFIGFFLRQSLLGGVDVAQSSVSAFQGFREADRPKRKCSSISSRTMATPAAMTKPPTEDSKLSQSQPNPAS